MLEAADVLLINQRPAIQEMSLAKLTSYFAAGRPVLAAVAATSETARELEPAEAGIRMEAGEPTALARAIVDLKASPDRGEALGSNGRRLVARVLAPEMVLPEYERFLYEVAGAS